MPIIQQPLPSLIHSVNWLHILTNAFLIACAVCIIGCVLRLIFGGGSRTVCAVSAFVNLVFTYLVIIVMYALIPNARDTASVLPFASVTKDTFCLWDIQTLSTSQLLPALLQLFILSFLLNLSETLLFRHSKKKSLLYRLLNVIFCLICYIGLSGFIRSFAPQVFGQWAGYILFGIVGMILLIYILRVLLTVALTVVNPIVGALYAFFFSNIFGRQFTKAILTTLLSVILLVILQHMGVSAFAFEALSLASAVPTCLIALLTMYLFGKLL